MVLQFSYQYTEFFFNLCRVRQKNKRKRPQPTLENVTHKIPFSIVRKFYMMEAHSRELSSVIEPMELARRRDQFDGLRICRHIHPVALAFLYVKRRERILSIL